jgi:predicted permease
VTLIILDCTQKYITSYGLVLCFGIYQVVSMVLIINYFKPKINEIEVANFQSKRIPIIFVMLFITSLEVKTKK